MRIPSTDLEDLELPAVVPDRPREEGALRIGFVGAGQGGVRLVEAFGALDHSALFGVNTTAQDLTRLSAFMVLATPGQPGGAGKDPEVAARALAARRQEVFTALGRHLGAVDHIFVCLGLGGGTGSGCVEPLVQLSTRYLQQIGMDDPARRVGVIAALPKHSELSSPTVVRNARTYAERLSEMSREGQISSLVLLDNGKLETLYHGKLSVSQFYPKINAAMAQVLVTFNRLAATPSDLVTFDGRDLATILRGGGHLTGGVTVLRAGDLDSRDAASQALTRDFERTLLSGDFELSTAKRVGVVVVAGRRLLDEHVRLQEILDHVFDAVHTICGSADMYRGVYADDESSTVRIFTLIGGLDIPVRRYARLAGG